MRKIPLLCALIGLLIVVGCVQDDEGVSEVVGRETAVTTPTPTQTPIPSTSTPEPTNTETPIPTETLTPTITPMPTWSPPPTPTPMQPVPYIDNPYHLKAYDFKSYIDLLQMCMWSHEVVCKDLNSRSFFEVVVADFERFYPNGNPDAIQVIEEYPFPSNVYIMDTSYQLSALRKTIHAGLIQYLNAKNITLSPEFELGLPDLLLEAVPYNVDEDTELEWVLHLHFLRYMLQDWVTVEVDDQGHYKIIPNELERQFYRFSTETNVENDLTGDGRLELLLITHDYLTYGGYGVFVEIHSWEDERFQSIGSIYSTSGDEEINYEFVDSNNNGLPEIHISQQKNAYYDCVWEQLDIYEWDGNEFKHIVVGDEMPETAVCKIARGITGRIEYEPIPIDERIALLENALQDLTLENAPSADYLAFVKVQLATLYAGQNEDEAAMQLLQSILDYPTTGNPFVQLVYESLRVSDSSPVAVCNYLYESAVGKSSWYPEGVDYFINIAQEVISHYPTMTGSIVPELVCPLDDLILNRLDASLLSATKSPTDAMNAFGIPVSTILFANLDDDTDDEWVGYVDLRKPSIVLLDKVEEEWEAIAIYTPYSAFQIIQHDYLLQDFDDDGTLDLLLGLWGEEVAPGPPLHNTNYLILITSNESGLELHYKPIYPEEPVELSELTLDYFEANGSSESWPIWVELAKQFGINGDLMDYATGLTQRMISQERPLSTLTDLETLLSRLPDDPEVEPLRRQLLFLRGYHYELSGEEETAVSHYLNLVHRAPDSPWSWLAWARLKPE